MAKMESMVLDHEEAIILALEKTTQATAMIEELLHASNRYTSVEETLCGMSKMSYYSTPTSTTDTSSIIDVLSPHNFEEIGERVQQQTDEHSFSLSLSLVFWKTLPR